MYYSQNGEDFLLWNLFDFKEDGFFVDVGAFDGVHLSNSYSFEKQGWKGICIEAAPTYFSLCVQARQHSFCLHAACVDKEKLQTIDLHSEELGLLSGTKGGREDDVYRRYRTRGLAFHGFEKIMVPAVTLNEVLRQYHCESGKIDFISADVEDTEDSVLNGIYLFRYRPRVLIVEANDPGLKAANDAYSLKARYFEGRTVGPNTFYLRDSTDLEKLRRIAIDCRIEPNLHPLGEKYTIRAHITGKVICEKRDEKFGQ